MTEEIINLDKSDTLYLLGDYIDRGPDSKGVTDYILMLQQDGNRIFSLMGNHEDMMLDSMKGGDPFRLWMRNGGAITLESFGLHSVILNGTETGWNLPENYYNFFSNLKMYVELDDTILVHAGLDLSLPDPFSEQWVMLWIRESVIDPHTLGDRKIIHGHTPLPLEEIKASIDDPFTADINIDGGCVYTMYRSLGYLTALDLDKWDLMWVRNMDG
jgi:serine/threonine protein phosphatase 1